MRRVRMQRTPRSNRGHRAEPLAVPQTLPPRGEGADGGGSKDVTVHADELVARIDALVGRRDERDCR